MNLKFAVLNNTIEDQNNNNHFSAFHDTPDRTSKKSFSAKMFSNIIISFDGARRNEKKVDFQISH